ncbi:MAG TPA: tryptophan synthase subunit alpha [Leptospiraceae bacterium]|nr:tryptophan synthase subunit alpha [Spirochaetaceae bacterium]HBS06021.1 tryptophan synthase subunit alpha [Leptospiraceae bacterium]
MKLQNYIENRIKSENRPLYMPYITSGDPDFQHTVDYAVAMIDGGADVLELGIPFSDPTADGPVVQQAMVRAMARSDFSIDHVLQTAYDIHQQRPEVPIVLLGYLNPILSHFFAELDPENERKADPVLDEDSGCHKSIDRFLNRALECGVLGVVIPDLPFDSPEAELFRNHPSQISLINMIAPNTTPSREKAICKQAQGFIYYVSSLGTTGERKDLPEETAEKVARLKKDSGVPLFVGFGISRPDQARQLASHVDGVIVGSLNQRIIEENSENAAGKLKETTESFVESLKPALAT